MSIYDISGNGKTVAVEAGGTATTDLTVTNTGTVPATGLISVTNREYQAVPWLSYVHEPQRHFDAGASGVVRLSVQTTEAAPPGQSVLNVLVASEHNPDEDFATYDLLLDIRPKPEEPKRPWWFWLLIAMSLLVLVTGLVWGLVALFSGPRSVPDVRGRPYDQASAMLVEEGYEPELLQTSLVDLDGTAFQQVRGQLLLRAEALERRAREREAAAASAAVAGQGNAASSQADGLGDDPEDWPSLDLGEPAGGAEPGRDEAQQAVSGSLGDRLVWWQRQVVEDQDGVETPTDRVQVKIVPELVEVAFPPTDRWGSQQLGSWLVQHGMRYRFDDSLPPGYVYGSGIDGPPSFSPELGRLFRGTLVTIHVLPEQIEYVDLTKLRVDELAALTQYNFTYAYQYSEKQKKATPSWQEVQNWIAIQKRHDLEPYIYDQAPAAGTLLPRDRHQVTVFIDVRKTADR